MRKPKKVVTTKNVYKEIDSWGIPGSQDLNNIRITVKCKNENQKLLVNSIKDNDVTFCMGQSGVGKTFIACAEALKLLKLKNNIYNRIIISKSITQLRNEDIGILPGDERDKTRLYSMSFMDSFHKLIGERLTERFIDCGIIKFEPIGTMRGRSFSGVILICDEMQNINLDNSKTLLTRMSDDCKYILMGDKDQIDIKNKKESSLEYLINKVKDNPIEGVGYVEFDQDDIVRHRLTKYFLNLF